MVSESWGDGPLPSHDASDNDLPFASQPCHDAGVDPGLDADEYELDSWLAGDSEDDGDSDPADSSGSD